MLRDLYKYKLLHVVQVALNHLAHVPYGYEVTNLINKYKIEYIFEKLQYLSLYQYLTL